MKHQNKGALKSVLIRLGNPTFHTGQTPVMKYHRQLMNAILNDKINTKAKCRSLKMHQEDMLNLVVE
jgi:hypothetical protein